MNAQILNASCVAWQGRGALILGRSGAGKSALALQLMALGADLVSDDRTELLAPTVPLTSGTPVNGRALANANLGSFSFEVPANASGACTCTRCRHQFK